MSNIKELKGFVVFENRRDDFVFRVGTTVMLNRCVLESLRNPEYVNIFFDEPGKRIAFKASGNNVENRFKILKTGLENAGRIRQKVLDVSGAKMEPEKVLEFHGHFCGEFLIFDLNDIRYRNYKFHAKKAE